MALNTLNCNHFTTLGLKGLIDYIWRCQESCQTPAAYLSSCFDSASEQFYFLHCPVMVIHQTVRCTNNILICRNLWPQAHQIWLILWVLCLNCVNYSLCSVLLSIVWYNIMKDNTYIWNYTTLWQNYNTI